MHSARHRLTLGLASCLAVTAVQAEVTTYPEKTALFGELHLHTAYSLDAYIFGNILNDPFSAYRFAKGEEVKLPAGDSKKIIKPLDFAALATRLRQYSGAGRQSALN